MSAIKFTYTNYTRKIDKKTLFVCLHFMNMLSDIAHLRKKRKYLPKVRHFNEVCRVDLLSELITLLALLTLFLSENAFNDQLSRLSNLMD